MSHSPMASRLKPSSVTDKPKSIALLVPPEEEEYVKASVMAALLGVSEDYLWKGARRRTIPHVREGGNVTFPKKTLLRWWHQRAMDSVTKFDMDAP